MSGPPGTSLDGVPFWCFDDDIGFNVDTDAGSLVFNDADGGLAIPNRAMRFFEAGPTELDVPDLEGDSLEAHDGLVPMPRYERKRIARVSFEMLFTVDPDGVPYPDAHVGYKRNLAILSAIADLSKSGDGTQSITYTNADGEAATFDATVGPPILGSVKNGLGCAVGLVIEVPNPAEQLIFT